MAWAWVTEPLCVTDLVARMSVRIERAPELNNVFVKAELGEFKRGGQGMCYLTLRDDRTAIPGVIWPDTTHALKFEPAAGQSVLVRGDLRVYQKQGKVQIRVREMTLDGAGAQAAALDERKSRLLQEGLFDPARKRPLPPYPHVLGVVTSKSGAAVRDIITVAQRRAPHLNILVRDARVQGDGAAASIVEAIAAMNALPLERRPDVLIVGRGGGSAEDLAAFNEESVVRAISGSLIPVVSAVGHEVDTTLSDAAADSRAATPSAAAEIVTQHIVAATIELEGLTGRLASGARAQLRRAHDRLTALLARPPLADPESLLRDVRQRVDELAGLVESLSPLGTIRRGYTIALRPDGTVVRSGDETLVGEQLALVFPDSTLLVSVVGKKEVKM
ncbi:MAG: exodeoxyribonuclease VII large subunit [Thermoplasmatota archaeon]